MNEEVIDCIPSATLRQYIKEHPIELSIMQEATIVFRVRKEEKAASVVPESYGEDGD